MSLENFAKIIIFIWENQIDAIHTVRKKITNKKYVFKKSVYKFTSM